MDTKEINTTLPPADIIKINLLGQRERIYKKIEEYEAAIEGGFNIPSFRLSAALKTFYKNIRAVLTNDAKTNPKIKESQKIIIQKIYDQDNISIKIESMDLIDDWLYEKGLLKFDTEKIRKVY